MTALDPNPNPATGADPDVLAADESQRDVDRLDRAWDAFVFDTWVRPPTPDTPGDESGAAPVEVVAALHGRAAIEPAVARRIWNQSVAMATAGTKRGPVGRRRWENVGGRHRLGLLPGAGGWVGEALAAAALIAVLLGGVLNGWAFPDGSPFAPATASAAAAPTGVVASPTAPADSPAPTPGDPITVVGWSAVESRFGTATGLPYAVDRVSGRGRHPTATPVTILDPRAELTVVDLR